MSFANPAVADAPGESFEALAKTADQAREADRLSDAIDLYSKAVRLRPSWVDGWWWLGSIYYEQDRFSEAATPFKRFIALSPKPAPAYAFLALCEYETKDYPRALHHFQLWGKAGSPANDALLDVAGFHWAVLLTRIGRFNEALLLLATKAQKLGATPALTEAIGLASLRMAFLPEDYPQERREAVWLAGMATFYCLKGDFPRSDNSADRLLQHYGQEPNVHYFRGTLLRFEQRLDPAAEEFQKELQISPGHASALTEWAVARIEADRPAEALAPARRAVELDPQSARAHYILGRALLETGSYQESAHQLEIAKGLAPESSRVRFALSNAYKRLGRQQDSKREQAAFLALKNKDNVLAPLDDKLRAPRGIGRPE
ncbi:MAG: tetratricopeptide repeat protein [Candidatus Sulfotelmatobacter sp.]